MTHSAFSLNAHFPDMWAAIIGDWVTAPADSTEFPRLSSKQRSLLRQVTTLGMIGNVVVLAVPGAWQKERIEQELSAHIKEVLKERLGTSVSLAISVASVETPTPAPSANDNKEAGDADETDHLDAPAPEDPEQPGAFGEDLDAAQEELASTYRAKTWYETQREEEDHFRRTKPPAPSPRRNDPRPPAAAPTAERYPHRTPDQRPHDASEVNPVTEQRRTPPEPHSPTPATPAPTGPRLGSTLAHAEVGLRSHGTLSPHDAASRPAPMDDESGDSGMLNKLYTFDNLVVSSSNNVAAGAAIAVAEQPARAYNPLFVWGKPGLGKTHILHAIAHYTKQLWPEMRVRYVSSEELLNEFINSINSGTLDSFKRMYRTLDMLIVDDVQFFEGKEGTQEEFFHTFNALYQANKQIVLSSDRHPEQLKTLEDRLRTRFQSGFITDIQTPSVEMRMAILTRRAEQDGVRLPDDVKALIAKRYVKSIRELHGALTRVIGYCSLTGQPISLDIAHEALDSMYSGDENVEILPQLVIDVVAKYFRVTRDELTGPRRTKKVSEARHVAMYLCRQLTDISLLKVGEAFGRDHSTVMYANEKISQGIVSDRTLYTQIEELTEEIKRRARD